MIYLDGIILRLYEPTGARGTAKLTLRLPLQRATRSNLLEDPIADPLPIQDGTIAVDYSPFEVLTFRAT